MLCSFIVLEVMSLYSNSTYQCQGSVSHSCMHAITVSRVLTNLTVSRCVAPAVTWLVAMLHTTCMMSVYSDLLLTVIQEKRKRDTGKTEKGKNFVEEEKRLGRQFGVYSGFD